MAHTANIVQLKPRTMAAFEAYIRECTGRHRAGLLRLGIAHSCGLIPILK